MPAIEFNIQSHVGLITVNRPEVRNALDWQAMSGFASTIERAEQACARSELRALVVTGAGKAFISGGDLADLREHPTEDDARRMMTVMGGALDRLARLPCITLAAIEGPARGGGCEVALACDWRVAAEDSDMGFVQIRLGLTTGWGGGARLAQLVGYARALDLLALGRVLSAPEAYRLGIVTHLAPPDQALTSAIGIAGKAAESDPDAVRAFKRMLDLARPALDDAQRAEREAFPKLWAGEAHRTAVERFLGKVDPG
jgi:enoyl-CoA hydratase